MLQVGVVTSGGRHKNAIIMLVLTRLRDHELNWMFTLNLHDCSLGWSNVDSINGDHVCL